jgi:protein-tyrosine phosphatase
MAETLIRAEIELAGLTGQVSVESAGTGDWHLGQRMDRRAAAELRRRGYDGSAHRARQIGPDWLDQFDLLIAMDASNLRNLQQTATGRPGIAGRIRLFRSFDPAAPDGAVVPDPYDGGPDDFAAVFDLTLAAARGLVGQIAATLKDGPPDHGTGD